MSGVAGLEFPSSICWPLHPPPPPEGAAQGTAVAGVKAVLGQWLHGVAVGLRVMPLPAACGRR